LLLYSRHESVTSNIRAFAVLARQPTLCSQLPTRKRKQERKCNLMFGEEAKWWLDQLQLMAWDGYGLLWEP